MQSSNLFLACIAPAPNEDKSRGVLPVAPGLKARFLTTSLDAPSAVLNILKMKSFAAFALLGAAAALPAPIARQIMIPEATMMAPMFEPMPVAPTAMPAPPPMRPMPASVPVEPTAIPVLMPTEGTTIPIVPSLPTVPQVPETMTTTTVAPLPVESLPTVDVPAPSMGPFVVEMPTPNALPMLPVEPPLPTEAPLPIPEPFVETPVEPSLPPMMTPMVTPIVTPIETPMELPIEPTVTPVAITPAAATPVVLPVDPLPTEESSITSLPEETPMPSAEVASLPTESPIATATSPNEPVCFPGTSTVALRNGAMKRMDELAVGDEVAVGGGKFSQVFMFTHKLSDVKHNFVKLSVSADRELTLTSGHYLYLNGKLRAASTAVIGDVVTLDDGTFALIDEVSAVHGTGLYNPQTLHGDIVVDGVLASTYTTTVEPGFAHAALAPLRALFAKLSMVITGFERGADALAQCVPKGASL